MASEAEAKLLLSAAHARLSSLPNVVAVGVVAADGDAAEAALAVYVRAKVPREALKPDEIVPETVDAVLDGVAVSAPTKVIVIGDFKL